MTQLSGWFSLAFLIASFYLASRVPILNKLFGGLKRQLRWHHLVALISIGAMLWHLGLLIWRYRGHLSFLFEWSDMMLLSGWISLTGIILALPFAFFRTQISYRKWRVTHLLTCVSLISALLHTFLLFEPKDSVEWIIFLFIMLLGSMSILSAVILPASPFWGKKYQITKISEPRTNLFLIQLKPGDQGIERSVHYTPGQFIYLKFVSFGFSRIWHPFTIISRPTEPHIELFIKARGRDTDRLNTISLATPVRILAPFGTSFWKKDQAQLWISYGIGAAIFLAAIRSFPLSQQKKIHFICCDISEKNIFFSDELNSLMEEISHFTWKPYIGTGQQFVIEFHNMLFDNQIFEQVRICGHPGFQNSLKSVLISRGVKSQNIELEGLL